MARLLSFCLTLLAASLFSSPQAAAENPAKPASPTPVELLADQTESLLKGMEEDELRFIYATRMRDGTLRAVRYTRGLVSGAVKACGEAQPELKGPLDERYESWWTTLAPLMAEAESNLERSISGQDFIAPDKIRAHLELVSEAAEYSRSRSERTYVTTRKACEYLLENMDKTEKNLGRKLQETLIAIQVPDLPPASGDGDNTDN